MSGAEGGNMRRVKIIYPDGTQSYGDIDIDSDHPVIVTGKEPYELETFAATGAMVAVNDQATLKLLLDHGVKARPTGKQTIISVSTSESLKDRLKEAAKKYHTNTSTIFVEAAENWLKERGL